MDEHKKHHHDDEHECTSTDIQMMETALSLST